LLAIVRIRGRVNIRKEVEATLGMLRLHRINHCVLVPETPDYLGMIQKSKNWITWGKVDKKTIVELFKKRGMVTGGKKLDENNMKETTKYNVLETLVDDLIKGKIKFKDFPDLKPVFRLSPPRKGYRATRLPYPKGDLGDRKEKITELLERMV